MLLHLLQWRKHCNMSTYIQLGFLTFPTRFTLKGQHNLFGHALNRHFTDIGPSLASKVDTSRVSLQILLNLETAAAFIWD